METERAALRSSIEWHQLEVLVAARRLGVDLQAGLSREEAGRRLGAVGLNELIERGGKSPWKILRDQLTASLVLILIVAAVLSLALGDLEDAAAILTIVILNAALGFSQEYRAEKALSALKQLAAPSVRVRRDGRVQEISSRELVPGDILLLSAGNLVSADARVIESINLRTQESALTGESEPIEKQSGPMSAADLPLADRRNMVYSGTIVTYGRGEALVTKTGMRTEIGRIAAMIQAPSQEITPLQKRLDRFGRQLAAVALAVVAVIFVLGVSRAQDLRVLFLTAVSLAVAAVPEGLAAIVTIALALGAQRMLKRRALVRKLPAVETLGSVSVICSDKTGTLTQNRMTVTLLEVAGRSLAMAPTSAGQSKVDPEDALRDDLSLSLLLAGVALCNDSNPEIVDGKMEGAGDPTEDALLIAAARAGLRKNELENFLPRVQEIPFDSDRKRMTTLHRISLKDTPSVQPAVRLLETIRKPGTPYIAFTKGSVDGLLEVSEFVWVEDHVEALTQSWRDRIVAANHAAAQRGIRVLGLSLRYSDAPFNGTDAERALVFVGLIGMTDPPRLEAAASVATCKAAGIRAIMITGDHPLTALQIAGSLGIGEGSRVLTGSQLEAMTPAQLENVVEDISVYARVSPEHKLKIVQALQSRGHIVAMTGDGINDAPALKQADIGVAMGMTGTDVARQAADMVLLDDNFATIVAAVEEGRIIYDNMRKFIKYLLGTNTAEILVMLFGPLLGLPLPLLPLQILWINLVTDGLPALALSLEPVEDQTMRRAPYPADESFFARGVGGYAVWSALLITALSLGVGFWYWQAGSQSWQTMIFNVLALSQMASVLSIRSERKLFLKTKLSSNPWLLGAVAITVLLQLAAIYIPSFSSLFKTVPLSAIDFIVSLVLSTLVFWAAESIKLLQSKSLNPS